MKNTKFKQTEIGEIPEVWLVKPASSVVEIISGGTPKTSVDDYWNGDIPWLSVMDFNTDQKRVYETEKSITELGLKNSSTNILNKGMLIISARGTVGVLAQLGKDMAFNQSCYGIDAKNDISSNDFLYYALKSRIDSIKQKSHGSVFSTITRNTFNDIYLPVPPPAEQQQIASVLSSLDDKIELNRRMNKTLEEMGKALFKRWFVDFEFPNENGELYKSSGGEMVESVLGEMPKGWVIKELGEIVELAYGKGLREKERFGGRIPVYGSSGVVGYHNKPLVNGPGIIVGRKGNVGSVFWEDGDFFPIDTTFYVVSTLSLFFIYYNLLFASFTNTDSAVPGLSRPQAYKTKILVPSLEILEKFDEVINGFFKLTRKNFNENEGLNQIRDSLLPRLMNGKLRVNVYANN